MELLHNSYVKGGVALGALLGPGRGKTCKTLHIECFGLIIKLGKCCIFEVANNNPTSCLDSKTYLG